MQGKPLSLSLSLLLLFILIIPIYLDSLELRCEMRQIEMLYADRIGYNVGGRLMTASSLMKLL